MTYHVSPYTPPEGSRAERLGHKWQVKHEGSDRASSTHKTKKSALRKAKSFARKHTGKTIIVHKRDGTTHYGLRNAGTRKSPRWKRT